MLENKDLRRRAAVSGANVPKNVPTQQGHSIAAMPRIAGPSIAERFENDGTFPVGQRRIRGPQHTSLKRKRRTCRASGTENAERRSESVQATPSLALQACVRLK